METSQRQAACTLLVLAVAVVPAPAQITKATKGPAKRVVVQCTDADNNPIAGAEIYVWQWRWLPDGTGDVDQSGPYASDEAGCAETIKPLTYSGGRFDHWAYARVPGRLVGAVRAMHVTGAKVSDPISVTLLPSREIHGKVTVPDGFAPQTVTIRTLGLSGILNGNVWAQTFPRQSGITALSDSLPHLFDTKVAADGTFTLKDMPAKALMYLAAEGQGLGQAQWFNALRKGREIPEVLEIELHPESAVSGIVRGPDTQPLAGAEVALQRLKGGVQVSWTVTTDAEGRYRFVGLPEGQHRLKVTSSVGVMRAVNLELARGKAADGQNLDVETGVLVRGVVRNEQGKPVEGVGIGAVDPDPWGKRIYLGYGSTDPQGRFEIRLPTGPAELYFSGLPKGYAYPKPHTVAEIDVEPGDASLRALELIVPTAK